MRKKYSGLVIDVSHEIASIRIGSVATFEIGDPVGYIDLDENKPKYLGTLIDIDPVSRVIYVLTNKEKELEEDTYIYVIDYEPIITYDLQLALLDTIITRRSHMDIYNINAVKLVFEELPQEGLTYNRNAIYLDIRDGFKLDQSQSRAVDAALNLQNDELLLIIGPPGTGKTRVIARIAYELYSRGERVLITSHTNRAVDNAIVLLDPLFSLRVGRPEKILPNARKYMLGYKVREYIGEELNGIEKRIENLRKALKGITRDLKKFRTRESIRTYWRLQKKIKMELRDLYSRRRKIVRKAISELIYTAGIIGSTLIRSQLPPLDQQVFDTVIIDEASQASITLALLAMVKAKKWIIVGDHKQLQPIFKSINDIDSIRDLSVFTRLLRKYKHRSLWLTVHYRSNPKIIGFSAKYIYENKIVPYKSCDNIVLETKCNPVPVELDPNKPVIFINVSGAEAYDYKSKSYYNESEAYVATSIVEKAVECGISSREIGVITPYRLQKTIISDKLRKYMERGLEVNTVDAFQGREKDVIIYSVVATKYEHLKFASEPHRFNVAATRARKKLIVIGNMDSIERNQSILLYKFLEYCRRQGSIIYRY